MTASVGEKTPFMMMTPMLHCKGELDAPMLKAEQLQASSSEDEPRQIGRFTVIKRLGSGGMGVVYAAYDPDLDRRVALKILRPAEPQSRSKHAGKTRLLREAQAMAKLSHPNVVGIYEVGMVGDQVFIAMEFIKGVTLTKWLQNHRDEIMNAPKHERVWEKVLVIFIQAGRGLEAAHGVGIIHRDFKPDNVLIGNDGRVRVLDFGLARADSTYQKWPEKDTFSEAIKHVEASSFLEIRLTRASGLHGTPAYMTPEQHLHQRTDARSDQFSFCVTLYEGLYGKRPFQGTTLESIRHEVIHGLVAEVPQDSHVPSWLHQIVLRGLSVDPADRFPSMEALLDEISQNLEHPKRRSQRRWWSVLIGSAVVVGGSFGYLGATGARFDQFFQPSELCSDGQQKLRGIWDSERKKLVQENFLRKSKKYAEADIDAYDEWQRVEAILDHYANDWVYAHNEACRAARVEQSQSEAVFNLRIACLERKLEDLQLLTNILSTSKNLELGQPVVAAQSLPSIQACEHPEQSSLHIRLPQDSQSQKQVSELQKQLNEADLLQIAGNDADALHLIHLVLDRSQDPALLAIQAEALLHKGHLEEKHHQFNHAEETLLSALWAADVSRHDHVVVDSLIALIRVIGLSLARHEEAIRMEHRLTAALARLGNDNLRKAKAYHSLGQVRLSQGKYKEATRYLRKAVDSSEQLFKNDEHPIIADILLDLGNALEQQGYISQAKTYYLRATSIIENVLGPRHPYIAAPIASLGQIAAARKDYPRAVQYFERATHIFADSPQAESLDAVLALVGLGEAYEQQEQWKQALYYYYKAKRLWEKNHDPSHPQLRKPLLGICRVYAQKANLSKAVSACEEAVAVVDRSDICANLRAQARFELAQVLWRSTEAATKSARQTPHSTQLRMDAMRHAHQALLETKQSSHPQEHLIEKVQTWLESHS